MGGKKLDMARGRNFPSWLESCSWHDGEILEKKKNNSVSMLWGNDPVVRKMIILKRMGRAVQPCS